MSDRLTAIHLPTQRNSGDSGIADHGRRSAQEMIAMLRERAHRQLAEAQAVIDAEDHEFQVETYVGAYVQRQRETIQKSSRLS